MKPTIIILIILLISSACTVEKRVYNRGWNVQWRCHQSVQQENLSDNASRLDRNKMGSTPISSDEILTTSRYTSQSEVHLTNAMQDDGISNSEEMYDITNHTLIQDPDDTTKKVLTPSPNIRESEGATINRPSRSYRNQVDPGFGFRMLLFGAICIIMAVFCYFAAMEGGIAALLYFFGAAALGAIGVILLLVGVVALLIALTA